MAITTTVRSRLWIVSVVGILAGMPVWFFLLRGHRILDSDGILFAGWIGLSMLIIGIWRLLKTTPPAANGLNPKHSQWIILLGALWLHANAIIWLAPGLSDDVLRYRSDGLHWLGGYSPYSRENNSFQKLSDLQQFADEWDALIPYRHMQTIYLPTSQIVFTGTRFIESIDQFLFPSLEARHTRMYWRTLVKFQLAPSFFPWRIAFGGMTFFATWLLMQACLRMDRSPWWAVLIGWHPLAIIETSGMAHQDAIGVLLLAGAFLAWMRCRWINPVAATPASPISLPVGLRSDGMGDAGVAATVLPYSTLPIRTNRFALPAAGVLLALACGVKPIAFIAAAYWLIARPTSRWVVPFIVTLLLLGSVFLYQDGYIGFLQTLRTYTQQWEANGSFFHVIRTQMKPVWTWGFQLFIEPWDFARMVGATIVAIVAIMLIRKQAHWTTALYWLVLIGLLVAPVVYPWYLLWLLAIVPILNPRWGLTGLVFAATVTFNYRLWHVEHWVLPWSYLALEYLPVYAALAIELFYPRIKFSRG
jgi:hypothetical protein